GTADHSRQWPASVAEGIIDADIGRRRTIGLAAIVLAAGAVAGEKASDRRFAVPRRASDASRWGQHVHIDRGATRIEQRTVECNRARARVDGTARGLNFIGAAADACE